jgi:hypothetical protein
MDPILLNRRPENKQCEGISLAEDEGYRFLRESRGQSFLNAESLTLTL